MPILYERGQRGRCGEWPWVKEEGEKRGGGLEGFASPQGGKGRKCGLLPAARRQSMGYDDDDCSFFNPSLLFGTLPLMCHQSDHCLVSS